MVALRCGQRDRPFDIGTVFDEDSDAGINIPAFIPDRLVIAFITNSKTLVPGIYKPRRMELLAEMNADTEPNLASIPEAGYILGQRVNNLVEWATVAANSEAFAQQVARDYWQRLVKRPTKGAYKEDFEGLWSSLMTIDNYSVKAMLQRLIKTEAYGAP